MTRRRKILLINPLELYYDNANEQVHLAKPALIALHAFLTREGFEPEILDLELEIGRPRNDAERRAAEERTKALLAAREFDAAAVSCYSSGLFLGAVAVGRMCRAANPRALRVVGGYHATACPEDFLGPDSPFHFVVREEGEHALKDILSGRPAPADAPRVVTGAAAPLDNDIRASLESYAYNDRYRIRHFNLFLSRGCPFECVYCVEPQSAIFPKWRAPSVEECFRRIRHVIDVWNPLVIFISDPIFGLSRPWRREFLREMARHKFKNAFCAETRVDILEPEDIELVSRLPLTLTLGVESASPQMLVRMGKSRRPDRYLERLRAVLSCKTRAPAFFALNFLFNHPGETPDSVRETFGFLDRLLDETRHDVHFSNMPYKFYPGTDVAKRLDSYRRLYGAEVADPLWWKKPTDQQFHRSQSVIASREMKKAHGDDIFYWARDAQRIETAFRARWSDRTRLTASTIAVGIEQNRSQWAARLARAASA